MRREFLLVATMLISNASASSWQWVATIDDRGGELFIDGESVVKVGAFRKVWFRWSYTELQKLPKWLIDDPAESWYVRELQLVYVDCHARKLMSLSNIYRDSDGESVGATSREFEDARWIDAVPESIGERQLWAACHLTLPK